MHYFFGTKDKPPHYAGIAVVSLMILTGLTFAGTAVALTIMMPVLVVLSPILVPAVITSSFLATAFLASGSLGASGVTLLIWLYKKEEHSRNTLLARGGRPPDGSNKVAEGGKRSGGENPLKEDKPTKEDNLLKGDKLREEDKPPGKDSGEDKPPLKDKPAEGDKPTEEDKPPQKNKFAEGDMPLGEVKDSSIPEISKVMVVEQNPIVPKCCSPSTSTKRSHQFRFAMDASKARSIFMKEYQKVPRVGAFAYQYFTSRDKKYKNHIHI